MKRYNYDSFLKEKSNIRKAIITVCKNKNKNKSNHNRKYNEAQKILANINYYENLIYLLIINTEKEILEKRKYPGYFPKKNKSFEIKDGNSNKIRKITFVPIFPDQIIQELLIMVFKETFLSKMFHHSYASIPGKGLHKGSKYLKKVIKQNNFKSKSEIKYVCKIDIKKCYPSINHSILKDRINKKYKGFLFKNILFKIIDSYSEEEHGRGLAIGYSISQWLCNFILTDLDNFIKHTLKIKFLIRYMDDVVIFGKNKKELHKNLIKIIKFLENIKLKLKENWQIFRFDYIKKGKRKGRFIDFMGFKFFRDKTNLRRKIFLNIKRQAKKIYKLKYKYLSICRSFLSRIGWLRHCNSLKMYSKYIKNYVDIKKLKEVISCESRKYG